MPTCDRCGDEIEFRYLDGRRTPIHINGGPCTGFDGKSRTSSTKPFGAIESYVNPNAHCPVCGAKVYFYKSPLGGRVFFDDVGWPWPKHGCTDNPRAQRDPLQSISKRLHRSFCNAQGESLQLYSLVSVLEQDDLVLVKFSRLTERVVFSASVAKNMLLDIDVTTQDLKSAPSFVVRIYQTSRVLEFISGRKRRIDKLTLPRR